MKVVWLVNILMPVVVDKIGLDKNKQFSGGWIVGLLSAIKKINLELTILSVTNKYADCDFTKDNVRYVVMDTGGKKYYKKMRSDFKEILNEISPDIVHIFGTEGEHSKAMIEVSCNDRTLVSIQGLTSIYTKHYFADIPIKYHKKGILKDIISKYRPVSAIAHGRENMREKGGHEIAIIEKCKNVTGRTTWDRACVNQINNEIKYYHCNEVLRNSFYKNKWDINKCKKHTIFFSQAQYPIKGFHQLLKAMPYILKKYPDTHIYVAGGEVLTQRTGIKKKIAYYINEYPSYINELTMKLGLENHITYLGSLDEERMCKAYLDSHVFVMASSIENSPNSLGEAMLLGVPCVASCVGGVQDMLGDKNEGYIYPFNEYYMISHYVCEIFDNDEIAMRISRNAREHAFKTHDREKVVQKMYNIYSDIGGN